MSAPCPYCDEHHGPQALDGHLRLSHPDEPRVEELLEALRLRNRARRAEREMGKIAPVSDLHSAVLNQCRALAEQQGGKVARLLDSIRSKG